MRALKGKSFNGSKLNVEIAQGLFLTVCIGNGFNFENCNAEIIPEDPHSYRPVLHIRPYFGIITWQSDPHIPQRLP